MMKPIYPVVTLLSIMGLAGGALFFLDQHDHSRVPASQNAPSLTNHKLAADWSTIKPLPGYGDSEQAKLPENPDSSVIPDVRATPELPTNESADNGNHRPVNDAAVETTCDVAVHVTGLKDKTSNLYVAVFDSEKGFPKPEHSRTTTTIPVDAESVEFSLSLPDSSTTGIAIFQDLNGDGKLTKNGFGLPTEPYGFSNNARSTFGPPSFSQASFEVSEKTSPIEITVR
ncbi:MAG: DUF2141 domain-containing protein [Planctomycetaceae bacterium]